MGKKETGGTFVLHIMFKYLQQERIKNGSYNSQDFLCGGTTHDFCSQLGLEDDEKCMGASAAAAAASSKSGKKEDGGENDDGVDIDGAVSGINSQKDCYNNAGITASAIVLSWRRSQRECQ